MLVASGLVSSDVEAKAVAQRHLVNKLSPAALDERIEALRLCGWNHTGLLMHDADRLIERSVLLDSLGCALGAVHPGCACPSQMQSIGTLPHGQSALAPLDLLAILQDPM